MGRDGKERDKAKLDRKKAAKASAKAARKAQQAADARGVDVVGEPELARLERNIRSFRGSNRASAYRDLARLDVERARHLLDALMAGADGRNLQDLGALAIATGEARVVDDVVRGRYGAVNVWEHAPEHVPDAIERLRLALPRITDVADVAHRLRALGVVPLQQAGRDAGRITAGLLAQVLDDPRFDPDRAGIDDDSARRERALIDGICEALLEVDPGALWLRRERASEEQAQLCVLASDLVAPEQLDIERLFALLAKRTSAERAARLRVARLPRAAARFPMGMRIALLREVLHTPECAPADRAEAAQMLVATNHADAHAAILAEPEANVAATVTVCDRIDVDEAWSILAPLFGRVDVRDALLATRLARTPVMLDATVALLHDDPLGAMALLVRSSAQRASDEIVRAFELCTLDDARLLLLGVTTFGVSGGNRAAVAGLPFERALANASGPHRARALLALRALLPRAGAHKAAVRATIDRLGA
jgi:hypothetical protein